MRACCGRQGTASDNYVPTDGRGNESEPAVSHCVTSSSHLFPSPPIQAAAVGREGEGQTPPVTYWVNMNYRDRTVFVCPGVCECEYYRHEASAIGRSVNR